MDCPKERIGMKKKWESLKFRVACSRPGLAYAVMRGWSVGYKVRVRGEAIGVMTDHGRIVGCVVKREQLREERDALQAQVEGWIETARVYATNDADRQAECDALKAEVERLRVACDTFSKNETIFIREEAERTRERDAARTTLEEKSRLWREERDALKAAVEELNKRVDVYRVGLVMEAYDRVKEERDAPRAAYEAHELLDTEEVHSAGPKTEATLKRLFAARQALAKLEDGENEYDASHIATNLEEK